MNLSLGTHFRFRSPAEDAWLNWGLIANPAVAPLVRGDLSAVASTRATMRLAHGPAILELPMFAAVVREGLRSRAAASPVTYWDHDDGDTPIYVSGPFCNMVSRSHARLKNLYPEDVPQNVSRWNPQSCVQVHFSVRILLNEMLSDWRR